MSYPRPEPAKANAELRYRMRPYNYSVAWKITSAGCTPMRLLMMDFSGDKKVLPIADEYIFGPAFLACPVTTPPAISREVYLPAGTSWVDFWTGEALAGGTTISANAPVNIMPLYVRASPIAPLGPVLQYAAEKPEEPIELRVYRGADGRFTLYEDEGDSYNYEKGKYATIPFEWNEARQTLTVGKRSGDFPGMRRERRFNVVFVSSNHGADAASEEKPDTVIHYAGKSITVAASVNQKLPTAPKFARLDLNAVQVYKSENNTHSFESHPFSHPIARWIVLLRLWHLWRR